MWAGYKTSVGGGKPEQGLVFTSILLLSSLVRQSFTICVLGCSQKQPLLDYVCILL